MNEMFYDNIFNLHTLLMLIISVLIIPFDSLLNPLILILVHRYV